MSLNLLSIASSLARTSRLRLPMKVSALESVSGIACLRTLRSENRSVLLAV